METTLVEEATALAEALGFAVKFEDILKTFEKYEHCQPTIRRYLVLADYFKVINLRDNSDLQKDANTIQEICPDVERHRIVDLLNAIGNEENRIRIVLKLLINDQFTSLNKRGHGEDSEYIPTKKLKLNDISTVQKENSQENDTPVSSTDSVSTIVYASENFPITDTNDNVASTSNSNQSDAFITQIKYLDLISQNIVNKFRINSDQPSTSRSNGDTIKSAIGVNDDAYNSLYGSVIKSNEVSSVIGNSEQNDLNPLSMPLLDNVTETSVNHRRDLNQPSTSVSINDRIETITSCSNNEAVSTVHNLEQPSTSGLWMASRWTNDEEVELNTSYGSSDLSPKLVAVNNDSENDDIENGKEDKAFGNSIGVSSWSNPDIKKENDASIGQKAIKQKDFVKKHGYHLYKHLHEMFSNLPIQHIKAICKKLGLNKYEVPPDMIMNSLVKYLLKRDNAVTKTNPLLVKTCGVINVNARVLPTATVTTINATQGDVAAGSKVPKLKIKLSSTSAMDNKTITLDSDASSDFGGFDDSDMSLSFEASCNFEQSPTVYHPLPQPVVLQGEPRLNEKSEVTQNPDNSLVFPLMEMFPEACPDFIRKLCSRKREGAKDGVLDQLISEILDIDYPKRTKSGSPHRQLDPAEQLEIMKSILVDADPDYLQMNCDRLIDKPEELKAFIAQALETRSYPTLKDFIRKQQISAQQKQYTIDFSVEKFLEVIPNPFEYFNDPKKKPINLDHHEQHYAVCYLRNKFPTISIRTIREYFSKYNKNLLPTCSALSSVSSSERMKSKRGKCTMPEVIQNIPLLQEIAFYDHQTQIKLYLDDKKLIETIERQQAKDSGLMQTCSCCFDDEIMLIDVYSCETGCVFCKDCVRRGAEVQFGDGKLSFPCLNNCPSKFSLQVLQAVLTPKMFSVLALKKQVEEVKAAGIEDLETCPFCDFATIPARDDKLFRCLNPECMKESCRSCKEPSHVPLRCDEVEKDGDVKTRTYIENKMTEALLRTCYKCGMKFIKAEGCNKMTCSCGALMCYVCGSPVLDYKHFNGPGGENMKLCPLYSDTNKLHVEAILKGAEAAKQEIGVKDSSKLKIDPTSDIQQHYKTNPNQNIPMQPPINPFQAMDQAQLLVQQRAWNVIQNHNIHIGQVQRGMNRQGHHHHHLHGHHHNHP